MTLEELVEALGTALRHAGLQDAVVYVSTHNEQAAWSDDSGYRVVAADPALEARTVAWLCRKLDAAKVAGFSNVWGGSAPRACRVQKPHCGPGTFVVTHVHMIGD